ncbi:MAG: hypothetical protein UW50_C0001G0150 [Candidatus Wolfebacteria bacterium GW2011_GWA1_44_24]|uniref:Uncharacterized protein n=2 Tax=Candidatus Wolfeibacteriota TaxID=1752735 RepID=A0A0G0UJ20_9BACT|nr:MAG: hypothetical protein UU38_C0003G0025 [Candidatus Wolfebacteria bacterium GW2011_GWB1_41_12]KKT56582.1 MAG: hypothetical protein UW50_C0001G0150 [Candidatus Wolfebacteria bacterium GW2011_GWA1_44_24]
MKNSADTKFSMYNFILQIAIMLSLGAMVYLVARATPRVSDIEESSDHSFHGRLDKLIAKIPLDKIDFVLSLTFEKSLRKLKLMLMKWDNVVTGHIEKIKKTNGSELSKEDKPNLFEENASADDDSASIKE